MLLERRVQVIPAAFLRRLTEEGTPPNKIGSASPSIRFLFLHKDKDQFMSLLSGLQPEFMKLHGILNLENVMELSIIRRNSSITKGTRASDLEPSFSDHSGVLFREVHYSIVNSCTSSCIINLDMEITSIKKLKHNRVLILQHSALTSSSVAVNRP